jgi:hypothetical protein
MQVASAVTNARTGIRTCHEEKREAVMAIEAAVLPLMQPA